MIPFQDDYYTVLCMYFVYISLANIYTMVGSPHKCWHSKSFNSVDRGMQCHERKKGSCRICNRFNLTAYEIYMKPNFHWLYMFYCPTQTLQIQKETKLLALASNEVGYTLISNISTDSKCCLGVISAITG